MDAGDDVGVQMIQPKRWGDPPRGTRTLLAAIVATLAVAALAPVAAPGSSGPGPAAWARGDPSLLTASRGGPAPMSVIVRERTPGSGAAERLVGALGGAVTTQLPIIGGFSARVPASAVPRLIGSGSVLRVWRDGRVDMTGSPMGRFDTWPANTLWRQSVRLPHLNNTYRGAGVGVALIDTGVSPVPDLAGRIVASVDLTPEADGIDRYGHGTHLAGIVAGNGTASAGDWRGVAPEANVVSVKVAGRSGATDVSVVIAALQWVVAHRDRFNIRVLNLAFGTDATQSYLVDPLNYAVERAWFAGIFVVVSAGNRGPDPGTVSKPGDDPFVLTIGDADLEDTLAKSDDFVQYFSSRGPTPDGFRKPDLVAPGISIVSTLAPGSRAEVEHPAAVMSSHYIKGTGTSQSAAVVSGVAALMFEAVPSLTPNVAKAILLGTANKNMASLSGAGVGLVDANGAIKSALSREYAAAPANQGLVPSDGTGSLDASRGTRRVAADVDGDGLLDPVQGEVDPLGRPWTELWDANSWSTDGWGANSWSTDWWVANSWSANAWSDLVWEANSWSGDAWEANSWSTDLWN